MAKTLVIMRGASGSGKSTLAKEIATQNNGMILSTDEYFMSNGSYRFNPSKLSEAHEWNKLRAMEAMKSENPFVIIDNTNTRLWEYDFYVQAGKEFGYIVWQCVCTGQYNNIHSVPESAINRMRERFQEDNNLPHWSTKGENNV